MTTDWPEARRRLESWLRYGNPRPNPVSDEGRQFENDLQEVLFNADRIYALEAERTWPTSEDEADRLLLRALQARLTYGDGSDPGTPADVDEAVAFFTEPDKWPVYRRMTQVAAEAFCAAGRQPASRAGAETETLMDGGLETGLRILLQLALDEMLHVAEAVDDRHDKNSNYLKYTTPYGAINGMNKVREDILAQCAMWGIKVSPARATTPPAPAIPVDVEGLVVEADTADFTWDEEDLVALIRRLASALAQRKGPSE
jgi:hypothetical protein